MGWDDENMKEAREKLADLLFWDWLSRGGFRKKRALSVICLALLSVCVTAFCFLAPELAMIAGILLFIFGLPAAILSVRCLIQSGITWDSILLLTDPADALYELQTQKDAKRDEPVYGERHAFFFQTGIAVEYDQIDRLESNLVRRHGKPGPGSSTVVYTLYAILRSGEALKLMSIRLQIPLGHMQARQQIRSAEDALKARIPGLSVQSINSI